MRALVAVLCLALASCATVPTATAPAAMPAELAELAAADLVGQLTTMVTPATTHVRIQFTDPAGSAFSVAASNALRELGYAVLDAGQSSTTKAASVQLSLANVAQTGEVLLSATIDERSLTRLYTPSGSGWTASPFALGAAP